jgi:hypothetical protein
MQVGVNYPWCDYGWDFGLGPPPWRGTRDEPRWRDRIDEHLRHFQTLGISVVRWFVFADGLTYGVGAEAPRPDAGAPGQWRFDPPHLDDRIVRHFDLLLERFLAAAAAGRPAIRLLPVLIDFYFCDAGTRPVTRPDPANPVEVIEDPDWVKQGRADAIVDPEKRRRFLDRALEPLLQVSRARADAIYAWELINEPDWVTTRWHPNPLARPPVPEAAMRAFIDEGKQQVRAAGFKPTIGFASTGLLQRSRITAEINQFHYYPDGGLQLGPHRFDPGFPEIIGECATATTDVWPDLPSDEQGILHRLKVARDRGYPLTILWSFLARDRHTAWSDAVEQDIARFTRQGHA